MTQEMVGTTVQMEASLQRDRPRSSAVSIVQPSVTKVPGVSATGEEEAWAEVLWMPTQGTLYHQALCFRWFHKGRKEWLLLSEDGAIHFVRTSKKKRTGKIVRAGPCGHWHCLAAIAGLQLYRLWQYSGPQPLISS